MYIHWVGLCPVPPGMTNSETLWYARFFCPWDSAVKNIGRGCHAIIQGIFPTLDGTCASCMARRSITAEPTAKPHQYILQDINREIQGFTSGRQSTWRTRTGLHNMTQGTVTKTVPRERKAVVQSHCLGRLYLEMGMNRSDKQGKEGKIRTMECSVQENSKEK